MEAVRPNSFACSGGLLKDELRRPKDIGRDFLQTLLTASTNIGSHLSDGIGDAILVQGEEAPGQALRLSYNILQAAGADADFGYVGGAPGKVNLYVGKTAVKFNILEAEAVDRLKDLIREHAKWTEPSQQTAALEPAL